MDTSNINYIIPEDARNFDDDEFYMYAVGIYNRDKIRLFILPEYKNTQEFKQNNHIGMEWKRKFLTVEEAVVEAKNLVYDNLVIIDE